MIRPLVLSLGVVGISAGLAAAAPTPVTQFEPEPCIVHLAASYPSAPDGFLATTVPAEGLITCPPGVVAPSDPEGGDVPSFFLKSSSTGVIGPALATWTTPYYDPNANAMMQNPTLLLTTLYASIFGTDTINLLIGTKPTPQGTYDQIVGEPGLVTDAPAWIPSGGKNYRLALANPVEIAPSAAAAPACTVNLDEKYSWTWNQANYWVLPDSVVQCTGFTFRSDAYTVWMEFNSRQENQGVLYTASRDVYDPTTKSYSKRFELRLANNGAALASVKGSGGGGIQAIAGVGIAIGSSGGTGTGSQGAVPGLAPVWGRFSLGTSTSPTIRRDGFVQANGLPQRQFFQVNLARPSFAIKRATTVTLRARAAGAGKVRLTISADRNASFENVGVGQTYRRQTVLSNTPADHAVVKRGNRVIKRVKLSPYGYAALTIADPAGRNAYSVTMVETDDNFAGTARVVR